MNVNSVESVLVEQKALGGMKESTLERSLLNVNCVASVLVKQETLGHMKESTQGRSLLNVNNVGSVFRQAGHLRGHERVHTRQKS